MIINMILVWTQTITIALMNKVLPQGLIYGPWTRMNKKLGAKKLFVWCRGSTYKVIITTLIEKRFRKRMSLPKDLKHAIQQNKPKTSTYNKKKKKIDEH